MSAISLEIFILLVVPLYSSSRLQGSRFSIGAAFCGRREFIGPSTPPPKADPNKSSPKTPEENRVPPLTPPLLLAPPMSPSGLEKPKNSANMSSAFRGLNRNTVGPSPPPEKKVAPPLASGGGTCPFSPSSPYWS